MKRSRVIKAMSAAGVFVAEVDLALGNKNPVALPPDLPRPQQFFDGQITERDLAKYLRAVASWAVATIDREVGVAGSAPATSCVSSRRSTD